MLQYGPCHRYFHHYLRVTNHGSDCYASFQQRYFTLVGSRVVSVCLHHLNQPDDRFQDSFFGHAFTWLSRHFYFYLRQRLLFIRQAPLVTPFNSTGTSRCNFYNCSNGMVICQNPNENPLNDYS